MCMAGGFGGIADTAPGLAIGNRLASDLNAKVGREVLPLRDVTTGAPVPVSSPAGAAPAAAAPGRQRQGSTLQPIGLPPQSTNNGPTTALRKLMGA
jgi:hypothetical protein